MKKQNALSVGLDLKEFFEASVDALDSDSRAPKTPDQIIARNHPLFHRSGNEEQLRTQAVAHAAKALTALWKISHLKAGVSSANS
jgi:hypothetical protein